MAIYLLDTSIVIDALNRKRGRWELLRALVEASETLACPTITVLEIYADMHSHEASTTQAFLDGLEHYTLIANWLYSAVCSRITGQSEAGHCQLQMF